jgi:hypothetical protein
MRLDAIEIQITQQHPDVSATQVAPLRLVSGDTLLIQASDMPPRQTGNVIQVGAEFTQVLVEVVDANHIHMTVGTRPAIHSMEVEPVIHIAEPDPIEVSRFKKITIGKSD